VVGFLGDTCEEAQEVTTHDPGDGEPTMTIQPCRGSDYVAGVANTSKANYVVFGKSMLAQISAGLTGRSLT
jgi:hypothetical protein